MLALVTGGAGFIGSNLVDQLLGRGHEVHVVDDLSSGKESNLSGALAAGATLHQADIRDGDAMRELFASVQPEVVFHLAAQIDVRVSVADPAYDARTNVEATANLLETGRVNNVRRFVFASTGGAIMGDQEPPIDERSLPWPISPYGASKLCGEAYMHAFAGSFGIRPVALRFANVYGPYSAHKKGVITRFIRAALAGGTFEIFGDGKASRDFLHVDDLCRGILVAADSDLSDEVLHLASEKGTTINELARLILDLVGSDVEIVHHPKRPGEVERNFARADRAREVLGWEPQISLREGMASTIEWFRAHDRVAA
jgi:UDP-glucose 4-epimerase